MTDKAVKRPALCLCFLLAMGCARAIVYTVVQGESDGISVTVYHYRSPPDGKVTVSLRTRTGSERVIADDGRDRYPTLVEVVSEKRNIGVLVCTLAATDPIRVAFSLDTGGVTVFSPAISKSIRSALVTRYSLTEAALSKYHGDAIEWACSNSSDASMRFNDIVGPSRQLRPILWN